MKRTFLTITLFIILVAAGCVSSSSDNQRADCSFGESFDSVSRSCLAQFNGVAPWGLTRSIELTEDVASSVQLHYKNNPGDDFATACEVDVSNGDNVAIQSACSCSRGECTVGLIGFPNSVQGSLLYRFQDRSGVWGDYQSATVAIAAVNDLPTFCPFAQASEALDNCENRVTGRNRDCIAPGNPNNFTLGLAPDFALPNTLGRDGLNFYDQAGRRCYFSDSTANTWREQATINCGFTLDFMSIDSSNCQGGDGNDCAGRGAPVRNGNQELGQVYLASDTRHCYYFDGSSWQDVTGTYDQVIAVVEDTPLVVSTQIQTAYDIEEGPMDFANRHRFSALTSSVQGELVGCPGSNCQYSTPQHFNAGDGIDRLALRVIDFRGGVAESSVAFVVRNINDAPMISDTGLTLDEGSIYRQTFVLTRDIQLLGGQGNIVDPDHNEVLQNFSFVTMAADPTSQSECLSSGTIMSDLDDTGGAVGSAPFTIASDGIFFCDTGKGVARAEIAGGGSNASFRRVEVSFHPNANFTGQVQFKFIVEDGQGLAASPALMSLTYAALNDAPTFCPYSDQGHSDCGFLAGSGSNPGVSCLWNESPDDLAAVVDTSASSGSVYPNHGGFPTGSSLAGGAVFYDQRNDACYTSVAAQGWQQRAVQLCQYSLDAEDESDDCGPGADCSAMALPSATPGVDGLVFYRERDFACFISEAGAWNQVTSAHYLLKVDENGAEGSNTITFDTTSLARDPDGDRLSYTVSTAPSNGTLEGCPGANCRYRPNDFYVGFDSFTLTASDGAETEDIVVGVAVRDVNNAPILTYQDGSPLHNTTVRANEGAIVQLYDLLIDEGGQDSSEDGQSLTFDIMSSNPALLDVSKIQLFWETEGDIINTSATVRSNLHDTTMTSPYSLGDGTNDAAGKILGLRLETVAGVSPGETTITIEISDTGTPTGSTTVQFTLQIAAFGATHNDWKNVFAVGPMLRKLADVRGCEDASKRSNSSNCATPAIPATLTTPATLAGDCKANQNPNEDLVTFNPSLDGLVFYNDRDKSCWESHPTHNLWIPRGCEFSGPQSNCGGGDCLGQDPPGEQIGFTLPPTASNLRYADVDSGLCYISVAGKGWIPEGSYVNLEWNGFTPLGSTAIAGYRVFRRRNGFEFDYSRPVATISTAIIRETIDVITPADLPNRDYHSGQVFFYQVLPVDAVHGNIIFPQESFSKITIVLPPYNMVMVPRRIVNAEICEHLHQVSDSANDNHCSYKGIVNNYNVNGHFQLNNDLMMDRFEYGCDYADYDNQAPTTASGTFYDRSSANCYVGNTDVDSLTIGAQFLDNAFRGRLAGLPPLSNISQDKAHEICQARTDSSNEITLHNGGSNITLGAAAFRLPSRMEQVALAAWDTDSYSDSQIEALERGPDLTASPKCNSTSADTIGEFTDAPTPLSSAAHTLPGTASSGIRSLATGSDFTARCVSRYQVRSLVGNVREWSDERFDCDSIDGCTGGNGEYSGIHSNTSATIPLYVFDESLTDSSSPPQPRDVTGPSVISDTNSWILAEESNDATYFDFPAALPFSYQNTNKVSFEIGQTSGITAGQLHSDTFTVLAPPNPPLNPLPTIINAGLLYGGAYTDGAGAGRYYGNIQPSATKDAQTGFRCIYPIDPADY